MAGFTDFEPAALRIPLRGPFGQTFATETGKIRDEELALLRVAMLSRIPSRCPDDALDALGAWHKIPRYLGDGNDAYRARLVVAWATWEKAGSPEAVEDQIRAFGIPDVYVARIDDYDFGPGDAAWWSQFWLVLGPDLGGHDLADAATRIAIKRIVLKWKATHGYPVEIVVLGGAGPVLGWGVIGGAKPLILGSFTLGGATSTRYRIGRTLNGSLPALGDPAFILGGFDLT